MWQSREILLTAEALRRRVQRRKKDFSLCLCASVVNRVGVNSNLAGITALECRELGGPPNEN